MAIEIVTQNRKAFHDYFIEETFEAGVMLTGTEVKSLRAGKANLKDSYARIKDGEIFLLNTHISPYSLADGFKQHEPERTRKLLLHKKEIMKLLGKTREKGYTLVPTKIYFKDGKAKVEIGLARGKTSYDKRDSIKAREVKREIAKTIRQRTKQ
ncbi:MAG: SsrA-binding protein [Deltaproteobacteria bacterium GWA2_54_12]|nr:MAG: SsrA-binding protein [Deltaproteobacteria bacterium GWA2_54_12]